MADVAGTNATLDAAGTSAASTTTLTAPLRHPPSTLHEHHLLSASVLAPTPQQQPAEAPPPRQSPVLLRSSDTIAQSPPPLPARSPPLGAGGVTASSPLKRQTTASPRRSWGPTNSVSATTAHLNGLGAVGGLEGDVFGYVAGGSPKLPMPASGSAGGGAPLSRPSSSAGSLQPYLGLASQATPAPRPGIASAPSQQSLPATPYYSNSHAPPYGSQTASSGIPSGSGVPHHLMVSGDFRAQLFVGNLPFRVRWQDLKDLFRKCGTVLRADVALTMDNRSKGFGTVLFAHRDDAVRAVDMYNGFSWQTRLLDVRLDSQDPTGALSLAVANSANAAAVAQQHHPHPYAHAHHLPTGVPAHLYGGGTPGGTSSLPSTPPSVSPASQPPHTLWSNMMVPLGVLNHHTYPSAPRTTSPSPLGRTPSQQSGQQQYQAPLATRLRPGNATNCANGGTKQGEEYRNTPSQSSTDSPYLGGPEIEGDLGNGQPPSANGAIFDPMTDEQAHASSQHTHFEQQTPASYTAHQPSQTGPGGMHNLGVGVPQVMVPVVYAAYPPEASSNGFMSFYGGRPTILPIQYANRHLFVGNLPFNCQWQDLKDLFRGAGNILRADVALGPDGRSRGFGTVLFATPEDAENAVKMFNGHEYQGRYLKVHFDKFAQPSSTGSFNAPSGGPPPRPGSPTFWQAHSNSYNGYDNSYALRRPGTDSGSSGVQDWSSAHSQHQTNNHGNFGGAVGPWPTYDASQQQPLPSPFLPQGSHEHSQSDYAVPPQHSHAVSGGVDASSGENAAAEMDPWAETMEQMLQPSGESSTHNRDSSFGGVPAAFGGFTQARSSTPVVSTQVDGPQDGRDEAPFTQTKPPLSPIRPRKQLNKAKTNPSKPSSIAMPPPYALGAPMSPATGRAVAMTPSMPAFSFQPFPQTPPMHPQFFSPGLGPFSPPPMPRSPGWAVAITPGGHGAYPHPTAVAHNASNCNPMFPTALGSSAEYLQMHGNQMSSFAAFDAGHGQAHTQNGRFAQRDESHVGNKYGGDAVSTGSYNGPESSLVSQLSTLAVESSPTVAPTLTRNSSSASGGGAMTSSPAQRATSEATAGLLNKRVNNLTPLSNVDWGFNPNASAKMSSLGRLNQKSSSTDNVDCKDTKAVTSASMSVTSSGESISSSPVGSGRRASFVGGRSDIDVNDPKSRPAKEEIELGAGVGVVGVVGLSGNGVVGSNGNGNRRASFDAGELTRPSYSTKVKSSLKS